MTLMQRKPPIILVSKCSHSIQHILIITFKKNETLLSGLLDKLNQINSKFEEIQRALEKFLETKRHIFPRFYFISNEDLLEILANSRKPDLIQPHLKKLFCAINKLKVVRVRLRIKLYTW